MIGKQDFVEQVDRKSEMLYRIARSILRSDEDCRDALQETVLKAWENRHKLRDDSLFGTWITRILINECHSLLHRKGKYVLQSEVAAASGSPVPDPALRMLLDELPEKLRLPLVLHYMEGYTYVQIAQLLHVPRSTVRTRLSRARKALRMEMEEDKEAWQHETERA